MNRRFSEFDLKAIAAAHFCSNGDKQKVVSEQLKVSQPQVSRLLKHARKRGLLIDRDPVFRITERDRLLWEAQQWFVADDPLVRELRRLSSGRLRRVHAIYGKDADFFPKRPGR